MNEFKFEVDLNDSGNPYIKLPVGYVNNPVNNFCVLELTKYILYNSLRSYEKLASANENIVDGFYASIDFIEYINTHTTKILKELMREKGSEFRKKNPEYLIKVSTLIERDNLLKKMFDNEIFFDEMLFKIDLGFTVLVEEDNCRYVYYDNEWININKE